MVQRTTLNQSSSPWRTAGPTGCLDASSGRMMCSLASGSLWGGGGHAGGGGGGGHAQHGDVGGEHLAAFGGVGHGGVGPLIELLQVVGNLQRIEEIGDPQ